MYLDLATIHSVNTNVLIYTTKKKTDEDNVKRRTERKRLSLDGCILIYSFFLQNTDRVSWCVTYGRHRFRKHSTQIRAGRKCESRGAACRAIRKITPGREPLRAALPGFDLPGRSHAKMSSGVHRVLPEDRAALSVSDLFTKGTSTSCFSLPRS